MAEQTLTQKMASAISKAGITDTSAEAEARVLDALRAFSEEYPYLTTTDHATATNGVLTSWTLPTDYLELAKDTTREERLSVDPDNDLYLVRIAPEHPTGIQKFLVGDTSSLENVPSIYFYIKNGKTLEFYSAPDSGYTLRIWYNAIWTESNIPAWAHRAVVYFGMAFAVDEMGAYILSKSEGSKNISYKSAITAQDYIKKALEVIKRHRDAWEKDDMLPIGATRR